MIGFINNINTSIKYKNKNIILRKSKKNLLLSKVFLKMNLIKNIKILEKKIFINFIFTKNFNLIKKLILIKNSKKLKKNSNIYLIESRNKIITNLDLKKNKNNKGKIILKIKI